MQLFVTLLLYIYNIWKKKIPDQIIICLVFILVLNDLNALLTDSQNTNNNFYNNWACNIVCFSEFAA